MQPTTPVARDDGRGRESRGARDHQAFAWARVCVRAGLASVIAATALAGPTPASAAFDRTGVRRLLSAHGFSPAQTARALAALDRAATQGLPASMLENRIREGIARHAPPATIQRVLDDRLSALEQADAIAHRCDSTRVARPGREHALARLADSFAMGVSPKDLAGLLPPGEGPRRDLEGVSHAAEVMGRLARRGIAPADTRGTLGAALEVGWTHEQLERLVDVFQDVRRLGLPPHDADRWLGESVREKTPPERLVEAAKGKMKTVAAAGNGPRGKSGSGPRATHGRSGASSPHGAGAHGTGAHGAGTRGPQPHVPGPRMPPHR